MSDIGTYSFRRAQVDLDREEISRPSLSYWQDAWYRIRTNRRTLASLFIVVFMVLVAAFGPMLWHFDYDTQDLNQTSKPPWASRSMTVIEPYTPWLDRPAAERWSDTGAPADIQAIGFPSIEFVRLTWSNRYKARHRYTVYRTIVDPEGGPLGLPLGNVIGESENSYEDRIDLEQRRYWYSVEATFADGSTTSASTQPDRCRGSSHGGGRNRKWMG